MGEQPGQYGGIDAGVFLGSELEVALGRKAGLVEEVEVDEIPRLGARKDTGQLAGPEIGERFEDHPFQWWGWGGDVGNRFVDDVDFEALSFPGLKPGTYKVPDIA